MGKLYKLKELVIGRSTIDLITTDHDNFDPYLVLTLPPDLQLLYDNLTGMNQNKFDIWSDELLNKLRCNGGTEEWKMY